MLFEENNMQRFTSSAILLWLDIVGGRSQRVTVTPATALNDLYNKHIAKRQLPAIGLDFRGKAEAIHFQLYVSCKALGNVSCIVFGFA